MKRSFFQAAVVSILLYGCTSCTLTKKKLDGNYTRMLRAILNKFWRQHLTRHHLYGHLPPITKTIQVRQTRHAGHCWRSTLFSSISPRDRTLSGATTPGQSGPSSNGNKGVLHIFHSFSIIGASPSDCFVLSLGHSLGESYHSAQMQSVYSVDPGMWTPC